MAVDANRLNAILFMLTTLQSGKGKEVMRRRSTPSTTTVTLHDVVRNYALVYVSIERNRIIREPAHYKPSSCQPLI